MALGEIGTLTTEILTERASNLINKSPLAELVAGLELHRYQSPNIRQDLYCWLRDAKNAQAEIDYVDSIAGEILPIEVKAGMKGGMKRLWIFMREKRIEKDIRCSLESFGTFEYKDQESQVTRQVAICPLYAMSMLKSIVRAM